MPVNLYLSTAESPRNACVASQLNPVPVKFRDLVDKDSLSVNLYIVDGFGNYDSRSGDGVTTPQVSIGTPGATPIWLNTTWTPIANGWSGAIQTTAAGFDTQFVLTGMNPISLTMEVKLKNAQGALATVAQFPVSIYNYQIAGTPNPDVLVNAISGSFNLVQGADSGTITGLALTQQPVRVLLHPIRKPANGLNLFANVINGTITTDGFQFTLDGQPDTGGYWLDYVITFS